MAEWSKALRVAAWLFAIFGGAVFIFGSGLLMHDIHQNLKWKEVQAKEVQASVVCVREPDSSFKDCKFIYTANGSQVSRPFYRSESAAEGFIGNERIYYWHDSPEQISLSRACGLQVLPAEICAFLGMIVFLVGAGTLWFSRSHQRANRFAN